MIDNNTLEAYIVKEIAEVKKKKDDVNKNAKDHTIEMLATLNTLYTGQINVLYRCLTAHDNKYESK